MDIEQERTKFEEWYRHHHGDRDVYALDEFGEYADKRVQSAFNVWQARAALQESLDKSQDREDVSRIQFMADEACTFNTWKQEDGSWKYRLEWDYGTEWQTQWFDSPEEAIDHARRAEGEA